MLSDWSSSHSRHRCSLRLASAIASSARSSSSIKAASACERSSAEPSKSPESPKSAKAASIFSVAAPISSKHPCTSLIRGFSVQTSKNLGFVWRLGLIRGFYV